MKLLKTFKDEFVIDDEENGKIEKLIELGTTSQLLKLKCGAIINMSIISSITDIPKIAYSQGGYPLEKNGRSFIRDGQRVYVEDLNTIQYLPDPKYKEQFNLLKEKNG